jgi:hypothetical protein
MSLATLNIKVTPRRMLSSGEAATYCGIPAKSFINSCGMHPVKMPNGKTLYDIRDLDTWLDSLKSEAPDSDDAIVGRLGK